MTDKQKQWVFFFFFCSGRKITTTEIPQWRQWDRPPARPPPADAYDRALAGWQACRERGFPYNHSVDVKPWRKSGRDGALRCTPPPLSEHCRRRGSCRSRERPPCVCPHRATSHHLATWTPRSASLYTRPFIPSPRRPLSNIIHACIRIGLNRCEPIYPSTTENQNGTSPVLMNTS